jgi:hypothetical protein
MYRSYPVVRLRVTFRDAGIAAVAQPVVSCYLIIHKRQSVLRTFFQTNATADTFGFQPSQFRLRRERFGIVTPFATHIATLEKNGAAYARPVM